MTAMQARPKRSRTFTPEMAAHLAKVRPNGRPAGIPNKETRAKIRAASRGITQALKDGISPLEVILRRMQNPESVSTASFDAAVAAAPYVHPKLSAVAYRDATPARDLIDLSHLSDDELDLFRQLAERCAPQTVDRLPQLIGGSEKANRKGGLSKDR